MPPLKDGVNKMFDTSFDEKETEILKRLDDFIPEKIFDAHCHLSNASHAPDGMLKELSDRGALEWRDDMKALYGKRDVRALLLAFPTAPMKNNPELVKEVNEWMQRQVELLPECFGTIYTVPGDTPEKLESLIVNDRIKGFKPYHLTSGGEGETSQHDICQYLPEAAWQVAEEKHMTITLHMVKDKALSDPVNMAYIKEHAKKYPHAVLILAHCARGFASWTAIEAVREIKDIPNVYYDLAAICDPATMFEIIRQAGTHKVMWGTDYPIDRIAGRPINMGDYFTWIYPYQLPDGLNIPVKKTVIESLFSFYQASLMLDMTKKDIEQVFNNTAAELFGF